MENLLDETRSKLNENDKTEADVRWVGSADGTYAMPWEAFVVIANVNYDDGYGSQEIARDLVVVGDDWWLERHEYDGAEGWEFRRAPTMQHDARVFSTVMNGDCWATVHEMNRFGGKYSGVE
jgi:hypothetical protein